MATLVASGAAAVIVMALWSARPQPPVPIPDTAPSPSSLGDLLSLSPGDLEKVDLAVVNLLCAEGLPGADDLDIRHAVATLDRWAERVRSETQRHLYRARDPGWADYYRHSEAFLRAMFLVQVLYEDLGVKYNLAVKDSFEFKDSRVAFIHGMIPGSGQTMADRPGGTCASMPVMIAAVGRRVGYPLRLVTTGSENGTGSIVCPRLRDWSVEQSSLQATREEDANEMSR